MIFETLHESNHKGELILLDGGYCRWHLRRNGVITIYEILSQRPGAGSEMLERLRALALPIVAKCPSDLPSNIWYAKRGFVLSRVETTPRGRTLNVWRLEAC
jgi:hypothetical protein